METHTKADTTTSSLPRRDSPRRITTLPAVIGVFVIIAAGAMLSPAVDRAHADGANLLCDVPSWASGTYYVCGRSASSSSCDYQSWIKAYHASSFPFGQALANYNGGSLRFFGDWSDFDYHWTTWSSDHGTTLYAKPRLGAPTVRFHTGVGPCV